MERITQKRVAVFFVSLAALLGFFAFRLYIVQVVNATDGDSSISTYTYQTNVSAARGQILGPQRQYPSLEPGQLQCHHQRLCAL